MMEIILLAVRHGLTFLGGHLAANPEWGQDIGGDDISAVAGAVVTIVGVVWSVMEKRRKRKAGGE